MDGKRFAVVAEEIQKLVEQTRKAVDNIGTIVTASVDNTTRAVKVMVLNSKHYGRSKKKTKSI